MAIKVFKPITPSLRYKTVNTREELTKGEGYKPLLRKKSKNGGRGSDNNIAVFHRGGGHKQKYRVIDFKRNKFDIPGTIKSIEYDPNRSCHIALTSYADGEYRYTLAPEGLKVGDVILSGKSGEIRTGNCMQLGSIPVGTRVHNIELQPGQGGKLARSAGGFATINAKEGDYVVLRLPSSEMRRFHVRCMATIGILGNKDHNLVTIGKAGRNRWLGKKPNVRGVAMNPIDHPLGGGEGKTAGGRHPVSWTGVPAKGYKTRKKRKISNKFIVSRRKK